MAKPRHQRKHPLIIPGGEQRLIEKMNNAENESSATQHNTEDLLINTKQNFKLKSKFR